ncbi:MAG: hypothetical protein LLF76_08105 [Planctomycetaceae bacterium]|nr:hypothetical protein [Planctomycetaceae bacterium]
MTKTAPKLDSNYFLPYQAGWIKDPAHAKLWDKSRRIGATYAESYKAVRKRNLEKGRIDYWFSSADESAAFEFAEYCQRWCDIIDQVFEFITEPYDHEIDTPEGKKTVQRNRYVIWFPNRSRITCMSSNPKRFRSKGGDVTLDEFDWHDDADEMYSAAEPCLMWGGDLSILTTRSFEGSNFDRKAIDAKKVLSGELDPNKDFVLPWSYHYTPITVAVEQGLAEKIKKLDHIDPVVRERFLHECRARAGDQDKFNREYMCTPSSEAATLIPYDLYYACQDPNCLKTVGSGPKYMGFDIAREQHKTVIWIDELVGDVLVTRVIVTLRKTPYGVQKQTIADLIRKHDVVRACGDATGIGDMLVEELQREFGEYRVNKVKFTLETKDHLASLQFGRMQDRRCRVPDDQDVRESFHSIRKVVTPTKNVRYDTSQSGQEHGDEWWASTLAKEAANIPHDKPDVFLCRAG